MEVAERPLHSKMRGIVLPKNFLNLGLVVVAIVYDLNGDSLAPVRYQLQSLLPDLLDLSQVEFILGDDKAQVDQVAETLAYTRVIQVVHGDPRLGVLQHLQILSYLFQLWKKKSCIRQIEHQLFAFILDPVSD